MAKKTIPIRKEITMNKTHLLASTFTPFIIILMAHLNYAEEKAYPLEITMSIYPERIHYGDVCFLTFYVTNKGDETLLLPYGNGFLNTGGTLFENEKMSHPLLYWNATDFNLKEGTMSHETLIRIFPGRGVAPGETMMFHIRPIWVPMPEFAERDSTTNFRALFEQGSWDFTLQFPMRYHAAYVATSHPRYDANGYPLREEEIVREGLTANELAAKCPDYPHDANFSANVLPPTCRLRVRARSHDLSLPPKNSPDPMEAALIQEWFLEIPATNSADRWTMDGMFAHPYHVRNSPWKMPYMTPLELGRKRSPLNAEYREFYKSMSTRTPELLARIDRTNELAAKIIERSKEADTTFSQNMVGFIQLRGFLVDMRYAENEDAEQKAFDALCTWVDTTADKELWVKLLNEVGLMSIMSYDHFPSKKVESYREQFAERFQIK